jgi:hypothetical protein
MRAHYSHGSYLKLFGGFCEALKECSGYFLKHAGKQKATQSQEKEGKDQHLEML